eukprot:9161855-Lingulodinium_polyedra.AAC.1
MVYTPAELAPLSRDALREIVLSQGERIQGLTLERRRLQRQLLASKKAAQQQLARRSAPDPDALFHFHRRGAKQL